VIESPIQEGVRSILAVGLDDSTLELTPPPLVKIVTPDLALTVGKSGAWRGYNRGAYGSIAPDLLTDGNEIRTISVRNSNGNMELLVEGTYPQDEFTSIELVGQGGGALLSADATHIQGGGETTWLWSGTGNSLTKTDVIAVEFT